MITVTQAINLAAKQRPEYNISKIIDLEDKWGACYDSGNSPVPGIPIVTIGKETGEAGILTIPPLKNLSLVNLAPVVWSNT